MYVKNAKPSLHPAELHTFAVTNAPIARTVQGKCSLFVLTVEANLFGARVAKRQLVPAPPLMPDFISEETLLTQGAHVA